MDIATLTDLTFPRCPECGGRSFAAIIGAEHDLRCVECKSVIHSFGLVPTLAAALLALTEDHARLKAAAEDAR